MIARVRGTVWATEDDALVIQIGGLGVQVHVPTPTLARLSASGQPVELFTHLHLRENELTLYGFLTREELTLFRLLLTVAGVGPRTALAVLSTLSPDTVRQAVVNDQPNILTQVPGVGLKTAKAIIFHLKDKFGPLGTFAAIPTILEGDAEVIAALTGLGFSLVEAQTALQNAARDPSLPLEERIRRALAYLAPSRS